MKTIITIIAVMMALNSFAQYPPSGTVTIIGTYPQSMCYQSDSIRIDFKFRYSGNPDTLINHFFHQWIPPFGFYTVKWAKFSDFYHMTKILVGSDTIYSFKFWPDTNNFFKLGQTLICSSGQTSCTNIHVFLCIEPNGIEKLEAGQSQKPIYYDLYGNMIEPRQSEIMIEKTGNKRRKVVIQ